MEEETLTSDTLLHVTGTPRTTQDRRDTVPLQYSRPGHPPTTRDPTTTETGKKRGPDIVVGLDGDGRPDPGREDVVWPGAPVIAVTRIRGTLTHGRTTPVTGENTLLARSPRPPYNVS